MDVPSLVTGEHQIINRLETAPVPFFQKVIALHFTTGGSADRVAIESALTTLRGTFEPIIYDALAAGQAALNTSGDAVLVTLAVPRQVYRITLSSSKAADQSAQIELYRVDKSARADKPTTSAGNGAAFDVDFTDKSFAVRLNTSAGYIALAARDVIKLELRSFPTGARLGISNPGKPEEVNTFWQKPGEIGKTEPVQAGALSQMVSSRPAALASLRAESMLGTTAEIGATGRLIEKRAKGTAPAQVIVDAGEAMAKELGRQLDALPAPLPGDVTLNFVIASDAECIFRMNEAAIRYHLVLESFPLREAKQVLRFPDGRAGSQQVSVQLPAAAAVTSATLKTVDNLRKDRRAAGGAALSAASLTQGRGVDVGVEHWMAQPVEPAEAISATGIALGLMSIAANTELLVELQEDWQGKSSGKKLAGGTVKLATIGERTWATLLFASPVILAAQPYWLLVKAARGHAVWLGDDSAKSIQSLERPDATGAWTTLNSIERLEALYQLLSHDNGSQNQSPISLSIGAQTVPPMTTSGNNKTFDMTAAIQVFLRTQSAAAQQTIPLTFAGAAPGIMTVYPPRIEYEL